MAEQDKHSALPTPKFTDPVKLLIVVAPFYREIADNLVAGAKAEIESIGGTCEIVEVPGALEVPTAIAMADRQCNFDGFVALGCVIRGETTHYDTVCNDSSRAIQLMGLQGLCIGNGILTVENENQAEVRSNPKKMNKGGGAAAAALHLIALSRKWGASKKGVGFKSPSESILVAGDNSGPTTV